MLKGVKYQMILTYSLTLYFTFNNEINNKKV